jgi:hypothetical protein
MRTFLLCLSFAASLEAQWKLERVASTAGDDQMGIPGSMAVARSGEIFVSDRKALNIAVYDSSGRRVRTMGRSGAGPGEFQYINGFGWLADTLVVYDRRLSRLNFLRVDGSVLHTTPWVGNLRPSQFLGAGGPAFYLAAYGPGRSEPLPPPMNGTRHIDPPKTFLKVGSDGSLTYLAMPTLHREPTGTDCWADASRTYILTEVPGGQGPFNAFTTTGAFVYLSPDRTQLRWRRGEVETNVPYPPIALTDDMWAREAAEYLALERRLGKLTCSEPMRRSATLPPLRAVVADDRGGVWVEVTTPAGTRFDVYDASGKLVGSAASPVRRFEPMPFVVRGERLYLAELSQDDLISITVFRVRR